MLEQLQERLQQQFNANGPEPSNQCSTGSRGAGPRLFCGHVPPVSQTTFVEFVLRGLRRLRL
jgi:hypothetical protein